MLTDLTDLSSCAAIGERLLKLWFEELDSLDQCPDVCTLNYMIDDLARMTAVHKSLLHMTALANKLSTPTPPAPPETPVATQSTIHDSRSTNNDSRSTTYRAPSLRETPLLRDIPMLRDLTPDQIRVELDRMIPYLKERHAEFHIGESDDPLPDNDLSEDSYDDSSDDFSEDFFEEEISPEPNPPSILPKNRSR